MTQALTQELLERARPSVRVLETVAFSQLALLGQPDDGGFQGLNCMLTLIQAGHGIDVEIHTQAVAELIGHQLGINAGLAAETGMRTPHDLKRGPVESDVF
jgi:hypothetical protein